MLDSCQCVHVVVGVIVTDSMKAFFSMLNSVFCTEYVILHRPST